MPTTLGAWGDMSRMCTEWDNTKDAYSNDFKVTKRESFQDNKTNQVWPYFKLEVHVYGYTRLQRKLHLRKTLVEF